MLIQFLIALFPATPLVFAIPVKKPIAWYQMVKFVICVTVVLSVIKVSLSDCNNVGFVRVIAYIINKDSQRRNYRFGDATMASGTQLGPLKCIPNLQKCKLDLLNPSFDPKMQILSWVYNPGLREKL